MANSTSIQLKIGNTPVTFSAITETDVDRVEFIAHMQELFLDTTCKKADKSCSNVVCQVREDTDENRYYELVCLGDSLKDPLRYTKKTLTQKKKGGVLFPKRRESPKKGGAWLPDNGWVKYNKETGKEE